MSVRNVFAFFDGTVSVCFAADLATKAPAPTIAVIAIFIIKPVSIALFVLLSYKIAAAVSYHDEVYERRDCYASSETDSDKNYLTAQYRQQQYGGNDISYEF